MTSIADYESRIEPARARFAANRWSTTIVAARPGAEEMERFLLFFCALGVQMTRPVESWIARAGAACEIAGLPELGRSLKKHARGEAGLSMHRSPDTAAV